VKNHPRHGAVEGLVRGDLTGGRRRALVRHLLKGCGPCAAELVRSGGFPPLAPEPEDRYDAAIDRALAAVGRCELDPAA
jgi:hypothetical protein